MLYKPQEERLWDCWIYPHEGKYYMYHLSLSPEQYGKGGWDGISLAISEDFVHWKEYGRIFTKHPDALWIGTGMIQKKGDLYIMNFSEERPAGTQNIYFAISRDLIHWERTEHVCAPDGEHYMNAPTDCSSSYPRWDSLGVIDGLEDKPGPYYAFLTASAKKVKNMNKNGGLGLVTSEDGFNWTCLPNAFPDTDMFPQFEVPEHVEFNGRHYVTFCTSSYLSHRFDYNSDDMAGGTFYVVSDDMLGPYRLPDGDYMLQGTRNNHFVSMVTVGRPLKVGDQIFYYHIWGDNGPEGWVGSAKLLEEEKPYKLRLRYNPINDCLKSKLLASTADVLKNLQFVKHPGIIPPIKLSLGEDMRFESLGTAAALRAPALNGNTGSALNTDLSDGRFITFDMDIESGEGGGIYFEGENGVRLGVMLNRKRQRLEFGFINEGWGPNMLICNDVIQKFPIAEHSKVKILARKWFIEVYIDDIYVSSWRPTQQIDPNRYGFYLEDCTGKISNFEIWEMV